MTFKIHQYIKLDKSTEKNERTTKAHYILYSFIILYQRKQREEREKGRRHIEN